MRHQAIRQYTYVYGAVAPDTGEDFSLMMPYANTECMNIFLKELAKVYPDNNLLIFMDQAGWHKSKDLMVPNNIQLSHIPPYSPELNPTENYWKFIRGRFFRNKYFDSFEGLEELLYSSLVHCVNHANEIFTVVSFSWIINRF